MENPDGISGYIQVGTDTTATSATIDIPVHRYDWPNARFMVESCNASGCLGSNEVVTAGEVVKAIGYFKASNTDARDFFGSSVVLSGDGNTLAVGAYREGSNATGINGNESFNGAGRSGAVYVFTRSGATWSQQAYVKASNTDAGDGFGTVALSSSGNTLAVAAGNEDSNATGVNGDQSDNSYPGFDGIGAGAVYIY